jgi:hypothetical protein
MSSLTLTRFIGLAFAFLLVLFSGNAAAVEETTQIDAVTDWGIEPVHLRITANGYMVEFRYRVLDTEKALVMSDRKHYPFLLALKSKAKLSVPYGRTVGVLKSNRRFLKLGRQYIAMFSNEGRHLLPGDKVKVQVQNEVSETFILE